jgi:ribosomal protein L11 methylase PrmA
MSDRWQIARIILPQSDAARAADFVSGYLSLIENQGLEERDEPQYTVWEVYFDDGTCPPELANDLPRAAVEAGIMGVRIDGIRDLERAPWHESWREYFQPVEITPTLRIAPSWHHPEYVQKDGVSDSAAQSTTTNSATVSGGDAGLTLFIEPGMAFGTGTHATTQLVLAMLEQTLGARPAARVLDAGTGSAILAIAAVRLGAGHVVAYDFDPLCLENARENMALNGVDESQVQVVIGTLDVTIAELPEDARTFDLVLCNMLSREFLPMLPALRATVEPGARMLLSGMLATELHEVHHALRVAGFAVTNEAASGEWVAAECEAV